MGVGDARSNIMHHYKRIASMMSTFDEKKLRRPKQRDTRITPLGLVALQLVFAISFNKSSIRLS